MTEQQATRISERGKALMINSDYFPGTYYGIHPKGIGISIINGNNEIRICADQVDAFLQELYEMCAVYVRKKKGA